MFNYNPSAYAALHTPPIVSDITNDGSKVGAKYNGYDVRVGKHNQEVNVSGKLANGDSFNLNIWGDPHATITITGPDGKKKSEQKFDFKEDSAIRLPDGSYVCVGTTDKRAAATFADRLAIISPNGSALTVSNIHSPGNLKVSAETIVGNPIDFLNRNIAPDGRFDGNVYNLGAAGLTTERGQRADQASVNALEAREDGFSSQRFGQRMAQHLLGLGLTPRGGACYQHGLLDLLRFEALLSNMARYGGLLPMRDRFQNPVLLNLQKMLRDEDEGCDCDHDALGDYLNQMPTWQPPSWSMNPGLACGTLANYFSRHGMNEMSSGQLRELAARGHGTVSQAAAHLLQQPNLLDYLDGMNGAARDGRVKLDGLRQLATIHGILAG